MTGDKMLHEYELTIPRAGDGAPTAVRFYRDHESHMAARAAGGRYGASSIAAALGLDPFTTRWEFWARKRGIIAPQESSEAMEAGQRSEAFNCEWYSDKMDLPPGYIMLNADKGGMMIDHPTDPLAACSPDLMIVSGVDSVSAKQGGAFELIGKPVIEWGADAKNHSYFMRRSDEPGKGYGEEWTDDVPKYIWHQLQWTLYNAGLPFWDVSAMFGGQKHRIFRVHAHPAVQAETAERIHTFHEDHILGGTEPDLSVEQLAKLNNKLSKMYRQDSGDCIEALAPDLELVRKYAMVRNARERLEVAEGAIAGAVKARMQTAQHIIIPGAGAKGADLKVVSWKTNRQSPPKRDDSAYAAELELVLQRMARGEFIVDGKADEEALEAVLEAAREAHTPKEGKIPARPFKIACGGKIGKLNAMLSKAQGLVRDAPSPVFTDNEADDQAHGAQLPELLIDNKELISRSLGNTDTEEERA